MKKNVCFQAYVFLCMRYSKSQFRKKKKKYYINKTLLTSFISYVSYYIVGSFEMSTLYRSIQSRDHLRAEYLLYYNMNETDGLQQLLFLTLDFSVISQKIFAKFSSNYSQKCVSGFISLLLFWEFFFIYKERTEFVFLCVFRMQQNYFNKFYHSNCRDFL